MPCTIVFFGKFDFVICQNLSMGNKEQYLLNLASPICEIKKKN